MEQKEIRIQPFLSPNINRLYSDFTAVNMSPYDITIDFGEIIYVNPEEVSKDGTIIRPIKARITLPIEIAKILVSQISEMLRNRDAILKKQDSKEG